MGTKYLLGLQPSQPHSRQEELKKRKPKGLLSLKMAQLPFKELFQKCWRTLPLIFHWPLLSTSEVGGYNFSAGCTDAQTCRGLFLITKWKMDMECRQLAEYSLAFLRKCRCQKPYFHCIKPLTYIAFS